MMQEQETIWLRPITWDDGCVTVDIRGERYTYFAARATILHFLRLVPKNQGKAIWYIRRHGKRVEDVNDLEDNIED